jgi:isoleucyl-tRNA synthetase
MSFTCEEVWGYLPAVPARAASVHVALFPKREEIFGSAQVADDPKQIEDWTTLLGVREHVLKALEEARNAKQIGKSLEAQVKVSAADPVYSVLARYREQLRYVFIVSAVALEQKTSGNGTGSVAVQVSKADGTKCSRCWNYSIHVSEDKDYPTVCERCSAVLKEIENRG